MKTRSAAAAESGIFDAETVRSYSLNRHGADGPFLLDHRITEFVNRVSAAGKSGVDPGCGSGWLSIMAAKRGAAMAASDINIDFVRQAEQEIRSAKLENRIALDRFDVQRLGYEGNQFDFAISSNVGCAVSANVLRDHLSEMRRVLKPGAEMLLTAPASLEQVFTNNGDPGSIIGEFESKLHGACSIEELQAIGRSESRIHRATILWDGKQAELIRNRQLEDGQPIFRLISGRMVVPNFWHAEADYLRAIRNAGLKVVSSFGDLLTAEQRLMINAGTSAEKTLGPAYERFPAFRVFLLKKP